MEDKTKCWKRVDKVDNEKADKCGYNTEYASETECEAAAQDGKCVQLRNCWEIVCNMPPEYGTKAKCENNIPTDSECYQRMGIFNCWHRQDKSDGECADNYVGAKTQSCKKGLLRREHMLHPLLVITTKKLTIGLVKDHHRMRLVLIQKSLEHVILEVLTVVEMVMAKDVVRLATSVVMGRQTQNITGSVKAFQIYFQTQQVAYVKHLSLLTKQSVLRKYI